MGNYSTLAASEEKNQTAQVDKAADSGWRVVSTQKWVQLGRLTQRLAALLDGLLALQAMASGRSV
jgi:hypothetical protein